MGEPPDRLLSTSPSDLAAATVRRVTMMQSRYWSCMYPKEPMELGLWTDRLHGEFYFDIYVSGRQREVNMKLQILFAIISPKSSMITTSSRRCTFIGRLFPSLLRTRFLRGKPSRVVEDLGARRSLTCAVPIIISGHRCWSSSMIREYLFPKNRWFELTETDRR